jgi:hypothetical protein
MVKDDQSSMTVCPICQGHYKKRTSWQRVCSPVCRNKAWRIKKVKQILDHAYEKIFAELEAKIKAGVKLF